jgi:SNF2 family DNA or RNA helicase
VVTLAKPPREYQELAAYALEIRGGLLLADDVGVGKTISGICALRTVGNIPALIVVPAHLPRHWREKLAEFAPDLKVHTIRTSTPYPLIKSGKRGVRDLWPDQLPDVIICSYHKLRGWAETLAGLTKLVIFEECQQLRNPNSEIYQACKHVALHARRRLGLSATPIYGYGSEFFWVVDVLLPGVLGKREEFVREWCTGFTGKEKIKETERFAAYLRREGIMLRRTRRDVKRELPPLQKLVHYVDADEDVLDKLQGNAISLAKIILSHNEAYRGQKMQAAGEFDTLLRQATGIAKAPYVAEFVRLLLESGEAVVLFGWHREVYRIWCERLKDFEPLLYTGTESPRQKEFAETEFKSGRRKLLIMSLRSGAGVDGLQFVSRTAVVGELDWSPGVLEQCIGRLDRDGQPDPVTAYYLVSEQGADPVMSDVLGIKREQIEGIRNPGGALLERIETGELSIKRMAEEFLARHTQPAQAA